MKALTGPRGPPGLKGARGPIGFAIKGDRGYPGIKGAKGSTRVLLGPTVKNGDPGEKGQAGPKGAKGSRGPPGLPKEKVCGIFVNQGFHTYFYQDFLMFAISTICSKHPRIRSR